MQRVVGEYLSQDADKTSFRVLTYILILFCCSESLKYEKKFHSRNMLDLGWKRFLQAKCQIVALQERVM